ncbi:hypothetical protein [Pedobacter sp. ASV12]|nr:hypothetical protein [Pedobacter sp. ASV12]
MKRKALKISSNTLFVYKSVKAATGRGTTVDTDPTTSMTATSSLTGIFQK